MQESACGFDGRWQNRTCVWIVPGGVTPKADENLDSMGVTTISSFLRWAYTSYTNEFWIAESPSVTTVPDAPAGSGTGSQASPFAPASHLTSARRSSPYPSPKMTMLSGDEGNANPLISFSVMNIRRAGSASVAN